MIFTVKDKIGEDYHINPLHIVYIKERRNYGLWKILLVSGESILTKESVVVEKIIKFLWEA